MVSMSITSMFLKPDSAACTSRCADGSGRLSYARAAAASPKGVGRRAWRLTQVFEQLAAQAAGADDEHV